VSKASTSTADHKALNEALYHAEQQATVGRFTAPPMVQAYHLRSGILYRLWRKTLPGIREAIEQRQWDEAQQQTAVAAKAITQLAAYLDKAAM